jgi:hypothetical protein
MCEIIGRAWDRLDPWGREVHVARRGREAGRLARPVSRILSLSVSTDDLVRLWDDRRRPVAARSVVTRSVPRAGGHRTADLHGGSVSIRFVTARSVAAERPVSTRPVATRAESSRALSPNGRSPRWPGPPYGRSTARPVSRTVFSPRAWSSRGRVRAVETAACRHTAALLEWPLAAVRASESRHGGRESRGPCRRPERVCPPRGLSPYGLSPRGRRRRAVPVAVWPIPTRSVVTVERRLVTVRPLWPERPLPAVGWRSRHGGRESARPVASQGQSPRGLSPRGRSPNRRSPRGRVAKGSSSRARHPRPRESGGPCSSSRRPNCWRLNRARFSSREI